MCWRSTWSTLYFFFTELYSSPSSSIFECPMKPCLSLARIYGGGNWRCPSVEQVECHDKQPLEVGTQRNTDMPNTCTGRHSHYSLKPEDCRDHDNVQTWGQCQDVPAGCRSTAPIGPHCVIVDALLGSIYGHVSNHRRC